MSNNSLAFVENVSSLFIVQTPFQAMCAINAIRQLKLENYTISLHLPSNTENRNKQTVELVEKYGLDYHIEKIKLVSVIKKLGLLISNTGKYNRVFLGTHLYHDGYYHALKEIKRGGSIVILDDGVATITLLKGGYKVTGKSIVYMAYYKAMASYRKVSVNNLLTVYKGIDNHKWNIAFNDISMLRHSKKGMERKNIYFIGTNNSKYITSYHVEEKDFKQILFDIFNKIKTVYPLEEIIYIPHGRDMSMFTKDLCEETGVIYKPLDVNIETYILSLDLVPRVVYGFTSSALYNLKMIFPESDVKNIVTKLLMEKTPGIMDISNYYEKQGITLIKV